MIVIPPLRTARLDVRLRELPFGAEIALCHGPEDMHEQAMSAFLAECVDEARTPSPRHVSDPRGWTVSERLFVLAHYNSNSRDDGPDYAVTETSKLSDYLDLTPEKSKPSTFTANNDEWTYVPLVGAAAETIELMQLESDLVGREHWLVGLLAAQLLRKDEVAPDPITQNTEYFEWLRKRMLIVRGLPSSAVDALYAGYQHACVADKQFFRIWFDEKGIVVLPKEAAGMVPAARFLVHSCFGDLALSITGKR